MKEVPFPTRSKMPKLLLIEKVALAVVVLALTFGFWVAAR